MIKLNKFKAINLICGSPGIDLMGYAINYLLHLECQTNIKNIVTLYNLESKFHPALLKYEWHKILQEVKNNKDICYIITTYSRDVIEAFNKANVNNEGIYIELYFSKKTGEILSKFREHEQLEYAISSANHSGYCNFMGEH